MMIPALMIGSACALEEKGLLRRAATLWQNVLRHPLTKENEYELAKEKLLKLVVLMSDKKKNQCHNTTLGRLHNIEEDKKKILSLLRTGATVKDIMFFTNRSQAYIYQCRKEFQNKGTL